MIRSPGNVLTQRNIAERGMAVGLRAIGRLASSELVDRLGLRQPTERFMHGASRTTMRTAATAGRTFAAAQRLSRPARQPRSGRGDLFDLRPPDEQQMLCESVRNFALAKLRPAAHDADDTCATPAELLAQGNELGLTMVGVPEELGGAVEHRSAVTSALITDIALRCVALCGSAGYGEDELLEKWARDAKILDLFEGTQQIQLLIVARQLLAKTSGELK